MLQFTHDGTTIEVDTDKLPLHEGLAIQKATGFLMPEWGKAAKAGDMLALIALGWVLIKFRMGKADVTFEDVCEGKVVITTADFSDPEAQETAEGNGQSPPSRGGRAKTRI